MFQRSDGYWCEQIGKKRLYAKTRKELKEKILAYREQSSSPLTLSGLLEEWLAYKEPTVAYNTYEGYKPPVQKLRDSFGDDALADITPMMVQSFVNSLAKKGYKRTTVQRPLDVLRMAYDYAITTGRATHNPTVGVRLPSGLTQEHRELAPREAIRIILDNVDKPFGLFPYMMMFTGLRKGELLAITDMDIKDGYLSVTKSLSWQPNKPVIKDPKTKHSVRDVELLPQVTSVLPKFKGYLFSPDGGKSPLSQTEFRHRWEAYKKETGLTDIVPYQLRHEFATMCHDADIQTTDTADMMGHSTDATTKKWYTHIDKQRRHSSFLKLKKHVESTSEVQSPKNSLNSQHS